MTDWEPATEAEQSMRDALQTGDQSRYFRLLAHVELLLPAPTAPRAGGAPGWGTWTSDGRTHVLAFTSRPAMAACLADHSGAFRRVAFEDLAATWPDQEWWLAVNPGLPIEGYLPAWFVGQLGLGDVRLPGRTLGAAARMEHARRLQARGGPAVPQTGSAGSVGRAPSQPVPQSTGSPSRAVAATHHQGAERDLPQRNVPPRSPLRPQVQGAPAAVPAPAPAPPAVPAPAPAPPAVPAPTPPPVPAPAVTRSVAPAPTKTPPPLTPRPSASASVPTGSGGPGEPPIRTITPLPRRRPLPDGSAPAEPDQADPALRSTNLRSAEGSASVAQRSAGPAERSPGSVDRSVGSTDRSANFVDLPVIIEGTVVDRAGPHDARSLADQLRAVTPDRRLRADQQVAAQPKPAPADSRHPMMSAGPASGVAGAPPAPGPVGPATGRSPANRPATVADLPVIAPAAPAQEPAVVEAGASGPDAFNPANSVERNLLEAAKQRRTDRFLSTLLLARVLVPNWPEDRIPNADQWETEEIAGRGHLVTYTSPERLLDRTGKDSNASWVRFTTLISSWPGEQLSFAVNPDTPVGATLPGDEIVALAGWATKMGLNEDPDQEVVSAPEEPAVAAAADEPLVMQKAVSAEQVSLYLDRGYDRVSGFVYRAGEIDHLCTPAAIYAALGLSYSGSTFKPEASELYLLRWRAYGGKLYRIPYGGQDESAMRAMDGWVIERAPFRGNGFAPSETGDVIAEFKVDSVRLPHGAQLWRLDREGIERLVALLDADGPRWRLVGA